LPSDQSHLPQINRNLPVGPIDLSIHLLSFAAPAFAVALAVTLLARVLLPRREQRLGWSLTLALNFVAGVVALLAGLWFFGRDGKMATYAAMVLVVATSQWLSGRAWRA
jgi:predicted anti-sigma-YlaC factor YlaD